MRQAKVVGEPDAGKPQVRFEVAGGGNRGTGEILRHSQRKRRETGLSPLNPWRHSLTLPADRVAAREIMAILTVFAARLAGS
jgi:hypothetical protein